ncbi:kinase-like domain-containing protein [Rhizophagus irregularis DAOM 181602=DAOM 197198]|uniref:Uncharacterized protein n=1 Tax=Rhizophagus irregularis (strain DAOM 181602 / DAOM 197198 / MUCL 43194) TaxID=747089 RepID=A0A2P4QF28_RHIID|nr:hypothetical protein GLOIN_2v1769258 [Rhizophagus irregularis DAOM 181602=DAOM 197198]POG76238.1 hypothetical protein GLOIN_2v1769258 [Rhizophagus irregularis DAOM 181602=DAOM 197198]GBC17614.2 kinase-like domain-containing protein [Rhizophagus irregularis DAOM 181602=DAOM 197198]CAG8574279.1 12627_t:CDS:2 [Rhizophagus irregularis]|eukprot:XP_025183104.1 hypothetical protein GLOIN_2v1769258 [Rhizophagus irregularis DAOM 181602=DAOM 197198]
MENVPKLQKILQNIIKLLDPDPKKRPLIIFTTLILKNWSHEDKCIAKFKQSEKKRRKLLESKKIGPEFAEKCHSEAIYISRPLSALISKLSTNLYSTISFDNIKQDRNYNYVTKEKEFDIDIKRF